MWHDLSARELRIAAKVARASGGLMLAAAADSWEVRAEIIEGLEARLKELGVPGA